MAKRKKYKRTNNDLHNIAFTEERCSDLVCTGKSKQHASTVG